MSLYIQEYISYLPKHFSKEVVSEIDNTSYLSGTLTIDNTSPFFPARSDLKIMRDDVKAAIVSIKELLENVQLSEEELENACLFVANGAFVEDSGKYLDKVLDAYRNFPMDLPEEQKLYKLYRMSPPLLALETLTNSSMSFISQYTGIKGHNYTFGNTSFSSFHALSEAENYIKNNGSEFIFVTATNVGGNYSFLCNSGVSGFKEGWKESAGGGTLLLSAEKENAKARISHLKNARNVPTLDTRNIDRQWYQLLPEAPAELLIFSGAFDNGTNCEDLEYCKSVHTNVLSLFEKYGNLGPSNNLIGITEAIEQLNKGIKTIDILDRDVYGRESIIRVEGC